MFDRTAKILPATAVALLPWSSPAWGGRDDNTALWLIYMPGDLSVSAIIWLANAAHMPWLIDALAEAMNITNGWFTVGIAVICWSLFALILRAVAAALKGRPAKPRKSVKSSHNPRKKQALRRGKRSMNERLYPRAA